MSDSVREQLLGHLLGALDEDEQQMVETRLQSDPIWQGELLRLRRELDALRDDGEQFAPRAGLAECTCRFVFAYVDAAGTPRRPAIRPRGLSRGPLRRVGWLDVAVAIGVVLAAGALIVPSIQSSRFRARVIACQDNLRDLGLALTAYSERHGQYLPRIPLKGNGRGAGIYASTLRSGGYIADDRRVICPSSPLAERGGYHVPTLEELNAATGVAAERLRAAMGGSYGYTLGYVLGGVYRDTKNLGRSHFVILADNPDYSLPGFRSSHHDGKGQNVLCEDLSIVFCTTTQLGPGGDDFYHNDHNLPAPGCQVDDAVIVPGATVPTVFSDSP